MISLSQKQLADSLLSSKLLTQESYDNLLSQAEQLGKPLQEIILAEKILDEEVLAKAEGDLAGYGYINLQDKEILPEVFNIFPDNIIEQYNAICFEKTDNVVSVAIMDPHDVNAMEAVDFFLVQKGFDRKYFVSSKKSFEDAKRRNRKVGMEVGEVLEKARDKVSPIELEEESKTDVSEIVKKAPISQVVSLIFKHAVDNNASDIHIEPDDKESRVRYRIDGVLHNFLIIPSSIHSSVVSRIKVLAKLKLDETRIPQDGRIKVKINDKQYDLRVSSLPLLNNEKISIRILETALIAPTLADLGFNEQAVKLIVEESKKPHGMFLITGPTGSGKSTTLYSALSMINSEGVNIVTLEDPIEYYINGVNQSLIRADIGYTFASGLRSILRQDPNIIMVGEIRDMETAELAVHAGLTGHLLFSTIHTNDAYGVVPRLIDMKVEPFLIASTLNVIIAQRLVRKNCPYCLEKRELPKNISEEIRKELAKIPKELYGGLDLSQTLYEQVGKGCPKCNNEGYKGRTVIAEVMEINSALQKLIVDGFDLEQVKKEAKKQGMINLRQDGLIKVLKGISTMSEIMRVSEEEEEEV